MLLAAELPHHHMQLFAEAHHARFHPGNLLYIQADATPDISITVTVSTQTSSLNINSIVGRRLRSSGAGRQRSSEEHASVAEHPGLFGASPPRCNLKRTACNFDVGLSPCILVAIASVRGPDAPDEDPQD